MISGNTFLDETDELKLTGKVIGKKGTVISNLKRETQVSLLTAMKPVGESLWVAVVIMGSLRNIISAYNAVATIVEHEVDDVILEFNTNKSKHAFLLSQGPLNPIVQKLSADSNVRIYFPSPSVHPPVASLEGSFDNVKRAYDKMVDLYNNQQEQSKNSSTPSSSSTSLNYSNRVNESKSRIMKEPVVTKTTRVTNKEINNKVESNTTNMKKNNKKYDEIANESDIQGEMTFSPQTFSNNKRSEKEKSNSSSDKENVKEKTNEISASNRSSAAAKTEEEVEKSGDVANDEKPKFPDFEQSLDIPSTLVGLLLARRPDVSMTSFKGRYPNPSMQRNVINQIQLLTKTVISRTSGPKKYTRPTLSEAISVIGATTAKEDEATSESNKEEGKSNSDKGGEALTSSPEEIKKIQESILAKIEIEKNRKKKLLEKDDEEKEEKEIKNEDENKNNDEVEMLETIPGHLLPSEPVTFKICGREREVNWAVEHLKLIIEGERIKDVMFKLKKLVNSDLPPRINRPGYVPRPRFQRRNENVVEGNNEEIGKEDEDNDEDDESEEDSDDDEDEEKSGVRSDRRRRPNTHNLKSQQTESTERSSRVLRKTSVPFKNKVLGDKKKPLPKKSYSTSAAAGEDSK